MFNKTINYLNLTNGIGFSASVENPKFIRIQSTTIEQKDWLKLLLELDYDFLMNLALGRKCIVYDMGTNRNLSKTISFGIPLIRFIINKFWFGETEQPFRLSKCGERKIYDIEICFNKIYDQLFTFDQKTADKKKLKLKLGYFKPYLFCSQINLEGRSISTSNDGNKVYFRSKLKHMLDLETDFDLFVEEINK